MKIIFDLLATVAFCIVWFKTFLFVGDHVPMFGYIPLGVIAGLFTGGIAMVIVHAIGYPFEKIFGPRN